VLYCWHISPNHMHCWLGMKSGSKLGSGMRGTRSALWRGTANPVSLGLLLLGLAWSGGPWAGAATLPPGFTEELVLGPWNEVVGLTFEPEQQTVGGPMYVWERGGRVWIVENGVRQSTPLIDLSEEVGGWRDFGLLGFALHPNFRQNGYLYLSYVVDHHHLTKFGTPDYHPDTNEYFMATIGRITRYTARASDGFHSVDPASRKVLLGESITNGFPITYQSHGVGSLVFGTDGSLMASCGDGGSYSTTDLGSASETYFTQALAEGIIRPKENIGALRAQLVDCLSGKIIRIDPETGNG
jgi:glucose/arabinose dehydrogenase